MFPAVAVKTRPVERNLYLAWSRPEAQGIDKGETKMGTYKFAAYPSNSSVASGVTVLVSLWFLVAAGAILSDPSSPYTRKEANATPVARTARVEFVRPVSAVEPDMFDTITVSAKRTAGRTAT